MKSSQKMGTSRGTQKRPQQKAKDPPAIPEGAFGQCEDCRGLVWVWEGVPGFVDGHLRCPNCAGESVPSPGD